MTAETTTPARPPLWRPIPLGDYALPVQDAKEGLARAWRRLWMHGKKAASGELRDAEPVPAADVAHLIPGVDLDTAAATLGTEIEPWLSLALETPRSVALVGPPGSGVQDVLAAWARGAKVTRLAPPSPSELDAGDWSPALPDTLQLPVVLPPLERLFLRRIGGLDLLRDLMQRLQREGRTFVCACDSWTWSYLRRTLPSRAAFDRILTPAPFTADVLRMWLRGMDPSVVFIDADEGGPLLAPGDQVPAFLRLLAARSRGISSVAAGIWGLALCKSHLGSPRDGVRQCRLPRWNQVAPPEVPHAVGKPGALLLHALLIHGGLDEGLLRTVLPLHDQEIRTLLWELGGQGIATRTDRLWRVSPIGYPAARAHLAVFNVSLDDF